MSNLTKLNNYAVTWKTRQTGLRTFIISMYAIMLCSRVARSRSSSSSRRFRSWSPNDKYLCWQTQEKQVLYITVQDQNHKIIWWLWQNVYMTNQIKPCWTFQSSPGVPGPSPSPHAPTLQRLSRHPPRTAAGPTVWSAPYLNTWDRTDVAPKMCKAAQFQQHVQPQAYNLSSKNVIYLKKYFFNPPKNQEVSVWSINYQTDFFTSFSQICINILCLHNVITLVLLQWEINEAYSHWEKVSIC